MGNYVSKKILSTGTKGKGLRIGDNATCASRSECEGLGFGKWWRMSAQDHGEQWFRTLGFKTFGLARSRITTER